MRVTVETVSFVGTRVPGRGGSYVPRPSLSACKNSLAVVLFRRSISGQQSRKTPSDSTLLLLRACIKTLREARSGMDDGGQWLFLFQMEQKATPEFERVLDDQFHEPDHGTGDLLVDSSFAVR